MRRLPIAAVLTLSLLGCSRDRAPRELLASGHVEAIEVRIAPEVGGRIVSFPAMEGDAVARGQEIARIDPTNVELALAAARAERREAAAELALRRAGARKEEIAEAEANLEAARGELEAAEKDLERLQRLLDQGGTVVVIEHDLDMIANADHLIDMGPAGGVDGGRIVATGTPAQVATAEQSITGRYLKQHLAGGAAASGRGAPIRR